MLPVYRITEGVENLENNYDTFDQVQEFLSQNKTVLIFSEGRCINEWHLRPLKKGTARIAISAWKKGTPVRVVPVGINYSNFRNLGKRLDLRFGNTIEVSMIPGPDSPKSIPEFNKILKSELSKSVYEIPKNDFAERSRIFETKTPIWQKVLLALPAALGYMFHAPLYFAGHFIIRSRANDHYDSIMIGILFLFYPLYLLAITIVLFLLIDSFWVLIAFFILPATALALLHYRKVV